MKQPFLYALSSLALGFAITSNAQLIELQIASGQEVVNHYPGPDGLIGTEDDLFSSSPSSAQLSAPNANGSYGFNAFSFAGDSDPAMPTGYDAITFVDGTITIDVAQVLAGGSLVNQLDIVSGTEPFPGHGPYTAGISNVNGGDYDPDTGEFTVNADFSYFYQGNLFTEPGVVLTGQAFYRTEDQFGVPTGNSYMDSVAVPLAQNRSAAGVVFMTASGELPNLGYPIYTTVVALASASPDPTFTINEGLNDAWYHDATDGQGFFIYVYPESGIIAMSWFTYDTTLPPDDAAAVIGDPGHRWVTAAGPFDGDTATMSVFVTRGMRFNRSDPPKETSDPVGTITIVWSDCDTAVLSYDFLGLSGSRTIERPAKDNVALCEAFLDGAN